jgi:hypothetical protein
MRSRRAGAIGVFVSTEALSVAADLPSPEPGARRQRQGGDDVMTVVRLDERARSMAR